MEPLDAIPKLYILVREDMSPGYQAVQGLHAAVDFCMQEQDAATRWWVKSNTVVLLGVENKQRLLDYATIAHRTGIKHKLFYEPDVSGYTALALEPGQRTTELCAGLSLALRQKRRWWRR